MPDQLDNERLQELAHKWLNGTLTADEQSEYNAWFNQVNDERLEVPSALAGNEAQLESNLFQKIKKEINKGTAAKIRPLWTRIAAAASILLFLSIGGYYIFHKQPAQQTARLFKNDISPGHNQATLTLANGKKIILTKGLKGQLATQGSTVIQASNNGITYHTGNKENQISYNTLTTARGEQSPYPLVLADGTKVWLNAQSSITFPTAFNGKQRLVKVTGEAFFEVAHNPKQPFKVQAANQTIEDIGTQFDVNVYTDEANTRTTLIEGSVKVNNMVLKPGEQTDGIHITTPNIAGVIAWKEGKFRFTNDNIHTIMRQLSRWYDIDVSYTGTITNDGFNAKISRNQNISVILSALERTNGVHFKIEGRRVTIIK